MIDDTSKTNPGDPPQGGGSENESPDPVDDPLGDPPQGGGEHPSGDRKRGIVPGEEGDPPQGGGAFRGIRGDPPQGGGD